MTDPEEAVGEGEAASREVGEVSWSLEDLPDGSGCAEIWDHLSERRRSG